MIFINDNSDNKDNRQKRNMRFANACASTVVSVVYVGVKETNKEIVVIKERKEY